MNANIIQATLKNRWQFKANCYKRLHGLGQRKISKA